jgi:hypothetical protein
MFILTLISFSEIGTVQTGLSATFEEQYKPTDPLFQQAKALKEQVSPQIEAFRADMVSMILKQ